MVPEFFIPTFDDPEAAWDEYVQARGLAGESVEALYEITYVHEGDRVEVRVGEPRRLFPRKTGPRGGRRPLSEGQRSWPSRSGSAVTAIMRAPTVIYIWSLHPARPWANPAMVGEGELQTAVPFDPPFPS